MINLSKVNKSYKQGKEEYQVLHDINLNIKKGEFVAIMGPSGSGKSTLIDIIGFLDQKFTGDYVFEDVKVNELNRKEHAKLRNQSVGFIFQNFKLINNQNVGENISLPLLYAGAKRKEIIQRVNGVLDQVGLNNCYHKMPKNLSGGQQQRVAVARAIVSNPRFLVADEPTGALDSVTSKEIIELFKTLNEKGTTIIMVTHDEKVANQAHRLVKILDGRIQSDEEVQIENT